MKKIIHCLGILLTVLVFSGCGNNKSQSSVNEYTKLDSLLNKTNNWRYTSLDSAFKYSYMALESVKVLDSIKKNTELPWYVAKKGNAYLNHANLFYLCDRFDSAQIYNEKYDTLKYKNTKISDFSNPDTCHVYKKYITDSMFYEFTYLKMLRDIQQIEMDLRVSNFGTIISSAYEIPLVRLSYQKKDWVERETAKNEKIYGKFYNNTRWRYAKTLYNIKLASYNFHYPIDNTKGDLTNCFDALFQLSRVSGDTTLYYVNKLDESTFFYYQYALANTYIHLADLIVQDTTFFRKYVKDLFDNEKENKLKLENFNMTDERKFLDRCYFRKIEIQDIVTHYYDKACQIYFYHYDQLLENNYLYWRANFMQDLAVLKNRLSKIYSDPDSIRQPYKDYLQQKFDQKKDTIDIEKFLIRADSLFDAWGGRYADYYQSSGNKSTLSQFYYSKYKNDPIEKRNKNDFDNAVKYINDAKKLNDNATKAKAYSFEITKEIYERLDSMYKDSKDSAKYREICEIFKQQQTYMYSTVKKDVDSRIDKLGKIHELNADKERIAKEKAQGDTWKLAVLIIFVSIVISILIYKNKKEKYILEVNDIREKERRQLNDIKEKEQKDFWRQLNNIGKTIVTTQLYNNDFEKFVKNTYDDIRKVLKKEEDKISFAIYQKIDDNKLKKFTYEGNMPPTQETIDLSEKEKTNHLPAIGCFNEMKNGEKAEDIFKKFSFSDWWKDYRQYYDEHDCKDIERIKPENNDTRSVLFFPIRNSKDENIGVVSFQHLDPNVFSETHEITIEFVANAIGMAMEIAELMKKNNTIMQENTQYLISEKFRFQLDNHFTKNALLKVGNIIDKEHPDRKYFLQFEELFEYLVNASKKKDGIPIKEDIQFLDKFISMNNVLYPIIEFEYHCDNNIMEEKIPPLILQPFVENSINWGIKPIEKESRKGKITINYEVFEITDLGRVLECTITDNGLGRKAAEDRKTKREEEERELGAPFESKGTSIGISSTIELLRHLNPKIQDPVQIIDLKNGDVPKGTKVIVKILLS